MWDVRREGFCLSKLAGKETNEWDAEFGWRRDFKDDVQEVYFRDINFEKTFGQPVPDFQQADSILVHGALSTIRESINLQEMENFS